MGLSSLYPRNAQPQYAASVNGSSPLAIGLLTAVTPFHLAGYALYGTTRLAPSRQGVGADVSAGNTAWEKTTTLAPGQGSIAALVQVLATPTSSGAVCALTYSNDSNASPYVQLKLTYYAGTTDSTFAFNDGSAQQNTTTVDTSGAAIGDIELWVGTHVSGTQNFYLYRNYGSLGTGSASKAGTIAGGSGQRIVIGEDYRLGSRNSGRSVLMMALWNRPLSATEVASLNINPWQLFAPVQRRRVYPAAAAAALPKGRNIGQAVNRASTY